MVVVDETDLCSDNYMVSFIIESDPVDQTITTDQKGSLTTGLMK